MPVGGGRPRRRCQWAGVGLRTHKFDDRRVAVAVELSAEERLLLAMLAAGATRSQVARRLRVSLRSVDARVASLRHRLVAGTPYLLGVNSVRHHHLAPAQVIEYARRRIGREWSQPTVRQSRIVGLLAAGATDLEAATAIGTSVTTVRRDLARLAHANGAVTRIGAGALFEALGWHVAARREASADIGQFP